MSSLTFLLLLLLQPLFYRSFWACFYYSVKLFYATALCCQQYCKDFNQSVNERFLIPVLCKYFFKFFQNRLEIYLMLSTSRLLSRLPQLLLPVQIFHWQFYFLFLFLASSVDLFFFILFVWVFFPFSLASLLDIFQLGNNSSFKQVTIFKLLGNGLKCLNNIKFLAPYEERRLNCALLLTRKLQQLVQEKIPSIGFTWPFLFFPRSPENVFKLFTPSM